MSESLFKLRPSSPPDILELVSGDVFVREVQLLRHRLVCEPALAFLILSHGIETLGSGVRHFAQRGG